MGFMRSKAQQARELENKGHSMRQELNRLQQSGLAHHQAEQLAREILVLQQEHHDAVRIAVAFEALDNLQGFYETAGTHEPNETEHLQQLWDAVPLNMFDMIQQKTPAWMALRNRHLFTGSGAFSLLLCGAGRPQHYAQWGISIPSYRKCVLQSCIIKTPTSELHGAHGHFRAARQHTMQYYHLQACPMQFKQRNSRHVLTQQQEEWA
jgi:hypothetical protein